MSNVNKRFKRSKSLPNKKKKPEVITKIIQRQIFNKIQKSIYKGFKFSEKQEKKQKINKKADFLTWSIKKNTFFFPQKMNCKSFTTSKLKETIKTMVKEMSKKPYWRLQSMKRTKRYKFAIFNYYKFHKFSFKLMIFYLPITFIVSIFTIIIFGFHYWRIDLILILFLILCTPVFIYLKIKQSKKLLESKIFMKNFLEQREAQLLSTISKYNLMHINKLGFEVKIGVYGGYLILRKLEEGIGRSMRAGTILRDDLHFSGIESLDDEERESEKLSKDNFSSVESDITQSLLLEDYDVVSVN